MLQPKQPKEEAKVTEITGDTYKGSTNNLDKELSRLVFGCDNQSDTNHAFAMFDPALLAFGSEPNEPKPSALLSFPASFFPSSDAVAPKLENVLEPMRKSDRSVDPVIALLKIIRDNAKPIDVDVKAEEEDD